MHKILYLSFNSPLQSIGVYHKEREFCRAAFEHGRTKGILFKGINIYPNHAPTSRSFPLVSQDFFELHAVESSLQQKFSRIKYLRSICRMQGVHTPAYTLIKEFSPDIVLLRYTYASPRTFNPKKAAKNTLFLCRYFH